MCREHTGIISFLCRELKKSKIRKHTEATDDLVYPKIPNQLRLCQLYRAVIDIYLIYPTTNHQVLYMTCLNFDIRPHEKRHKAPSSDHLTGTA